MTTTTVATTGERIVHEHPIDGLLRADRLPHILCPGCGIGAVIHCYVDAMAKSGIAMDNHVCVSGIGCSGRAAGYVNLDSYHTTHGRAIPFAMGVAMQNTDLEVTVISGDGDLSSIGGNHLIHAARRNVDINIICINNFNYGMTGGQAGPTTPPCAKTSTTPFGNLERPFNLPYLMASIGAVFVARWSVLHVRQLRQAISRAMQKKGFTFIEVVSPCPTGFGRPNDMKEGLMDMELYRRRCRLEPEIDLAKIDIDYTNEDCPVYIGNFVDVERPVLQPLPSSAAAQAAHASAASAKEE
jgi:2-oxoglutarate/2-oxoacid ferredoxin oxidoreductase subunit beta